MVPQIDAVMVSVKAPWWCSMLPIARASFRGQGWCQDEGVPPKCRLSLDETSYHRWCIDDIIFDEKIKAIYFQIFWNLKVKNIPYYQGGQFSTHLHSSIHQDDIRNPCHVFAFFTDTIAASLNGTPSQRPQQLGHHHGILIKWDTITASSLDRTPSLHPH